MRVHVERALVAEFTGRDLVAPRLGEVLAQFQENDWLYHVAREVERGEAVSPHRLVLRYKLTCGSLQDNLTVARSKTHTVFTAAWFALRRV